MGTALFFFYFFYVGGEIVRRKVIRILVFMMVVLIFVFGVMNSYEEAKANAAVLVAADLAGVGTIAEAGAVLSVLGAMGLIAVTVAGAVAIYKAYKYFFADKEGVQVGTDGTVIISSNAYQNLQAFKETVLSGASMGAIIADSWTGRIAVPYGAIWRANLSFPSLATGTYTATLVFRQYYCYPWQEVYFEPNIFGRLTTYNATSITVKQKDYVLNVNAESNVLNVVDKNGGWTVYSGVLPSSFGISVYRSDAPSAIDLDVGLRVTGNVTVAPTEYELRDGVTIPIDTPIAYNPPLDDTLELDKLKDMYYIPSLKDTSIAPTTDIPLSVPEGYPSDRIVPPDAPDLPSVISKKFPFSLPFDLAYIMGLFDAEPKAPKFDFEFMGSDVKIDLSILESVMPLVRQVLFIGTVLGVLFGTRKLLGGAE